MCTVIQAIHNIQHAHTHTHTRTTTKVKKEDDDDEAKMKFERKAHTGSKSQAFSEQQSVLMVSAINAKKRNYDNVKHMSAFIT